jgi:hypothetical protein
MPNWYESLPVHLLRLLPFSEYLSSADLADVVEVSFCQLAGFLSRLGDLGDVAVFLEVDELIVGQGVVDGSTLRHLHEMKDVFGSMILRCSLGMSGGVKGDLSF